jgi:hypothetical protein
MRWRYGKLLGNLTNAIEALCGPAAQDNDDTRELRQRARCEGIAVFRAAGPGYLGCDQAHRSGRCQQGSRTVSAAFRGLRLRFTHCAGPAVYTFAGDGYSLSRDVQTPSVIVV